MIDVVAGLIYKDNNVLIAKRLTGDSNVFDMGISWWQS